MGVWLGMMAAAIASGTFAHTGPAMTQAHQRYLVDVDEAAGTVTLHMEITKAGYPRAEFGWFLPVPALPTVVPSSDSVFDLLMAETGPQMALELSHTGVCDNTPAGWVADTADTGDSADTALPGGSTAGVTVITRTTQGPFETVVLQATSGAPLVTWLGQHGYTVNGFLGPALVPHLGPDRYIVAMRLMATDDADDDLPPIAIRWAGDGVTLPLRLTAMSSVDDLRIDLWQFHEERVIPDNWPHVVVDPLGVSWPDGGSNWEDRLGEAIDEAGGRAFTTVMSEPAPHLSGRLLPGGDFEVRRLYGLVHPVSFIEEWMEQGLPITQQVRDVLADHLAVPWHLQHLIDTPDVFYNCMPCYGDALLNTYIDPVALADDLEERVIAPMRRVEELLVSGKRLNHLVSVISPSEMTQDPTFATHPRLDEVPAVGTGSLTWSCDPAIATEDAPRTLTIDGRSLDVPSVADVEAAGGYGAWVQSQPRPALRIEDLRPRGPAVLLSEEGVAVVADTAWTDTVDTGVDTGHTGLSDTIESGHTGVVLVHTADTDPVVHSGDTDPPGDSDPSGDTDDTEGAVDTLVDTGMADSDGAVAEPDPVDGCGCDGGGPAPVGWALLGMLGALRRRVRPGNPTGAGSAAG